MRIKSVVSGGRRRSMTPSTAPSASPIPHLSTANDDQNATIYYSNSDGDNNHHTHTPLPDFVPETELVDSLDDNICITCNKIGGELLVCTQTDCPVSVHVNCIGSEPNFDDSGYFYCPYCAYKRALKRSRELREKAILAKKALSSFLEKDQTVCKDKENQPVEPEPEPEPVQDHVNRDEPVQDHVNRDEPEVDEPKGSDSEEERNNDNENDEDEDEGKVSESVSSVSETKDSDYEVSVAVKEGRANVKRKVAPVKRLLRERKTRGGGGGGGGAVDVDEEEVTSSRTLRARKQKQKQVTKENILNVTGRRKRLIWTAEEEKAIKEGVLKFAKANQNIPWRKILEFGCHVFDKTRTPIDLKDKWKRMQAELVQT